MNEHKTALVVDDDADIQDVLRAMLEAGGFQVDVLSDGIEAVHLEKWYDVILLDLKMPVFDGRRLTDYWRMTNPDILPRVIVMSGYNRMTVDPEGATFARLAKPFSFSTLMKVIDECIHAVAASESLGGIHV